jgi:hypothetical protein
MWPHSYLDERMYINIFLTVWYCKYNPYTPLIVMIFGEVWPIIQVNYLEFYTYRYNSFWFFIYWNFEKICIRVRLVFINCFCGTKFIFSLIMYKLLYSDVYIKMFTYSCMHNFQISHGLRRWKKYWIRSSDWMNFAHYSMKQLMQLCPMKTSFS